MVVLFKVAIGGIYKEFPCNHVRHGLNLFTVPTPQIHSWSQIKEEFCRPGSRPGLLIGNGASRAVWDEFKYDSLFEIARTTIQAPLSQCNIGIFTKLNTNNFEYVLTQLKNVELIAQAMGHQPVWLDRAYEEIRQSLIDAIHHVHIPRSQIEDIRLQRIGNELKEYDSVFTTNYDLLIYWAAMATQGNLFPDFFWSGMQRDCFSLSDTIVWNSEVRTKLFFLHGALHLYKLTSGTAMKRSGQSYGPNLLELFGQPLESPYDTVAIEPLIVSEGHSADKSRAIRSSDYLGFVYSELVSYSKPMVIFGHSLGQSDRHIIDALENQPMLANRELAISVYRNESNIQKVLQDFQNALPKSKKRFFYADTHPLGSADLQVSIRRAA